jgi:hypothetical protein
MKEERNERKENKRIEGIEVDRQWQYHILTGRMA